MERPTMDIILASVRLRQSLKLTLFFFTEVTMDIPIPMVIILVSVRLNLKQRLKLTLFFCMEDIMDTIWDTLDTMDMLDTPMYTMDKSYLTTSLICHRKPTIKQSLLLLP